MVLVIGEILVDVFPEYQRIGGAPFNFSYHLKSLGLPVRFISRIGLDALGRTILDFLAARGIDARPIQTDPDHPTGRVMVTMDGAGGHSFDIKPDAAYDHIDFPASPRDPANSAPELIYFGTLMQRSPSAFERTQGFLARRPAQTKCFYDINLRPNCFNHEIIKASLKQADILKINEDELAYVQDMFNRKEPYESFITWLMESHGIECLALTRGAGGSEIFTPSDHMTAEVPAVDDLVDTVGAGDAYSAMLAIGYLRNWPPQRILSIGTRFAADICRIRGAVPDHPDFYEKYMQEISGDTNG